MTPDQEIIELRRRLADALKKLEPPKTVPGGTCMAVHDYGSVCDHKPDYEIFIPVLMRTYILCNMHKNMLETCFKSLGIFFKTSDHDYKGRQKILL